MVGGKKIKPKNNILRTLLFGSQNGNQILKLGEHSVFAG